MQSDLNHHVDEEVLERYSMGRLPEEVAAPVEEHLLVCETCQDRLEEVDAFVAAARAAARRLQQEPAGVWERTREWLSGLARIPKPIGALALATAAVLAVLVLQPWQGGGPAPAAPATVVLHSMRGADSVSAARAPAGVPLRLEIDLSELAERAPGSLEIVDSAGKSVWRASVSASTQRLEVTAEASLPAGRYWVRLYAAAEGELLREFALRLE